MINWKKSKINFVLEWYSEINACIVSKSTFNIAYSIIFPFEDKSRTMCSACGLKSLKLTGHCQSLIFLHLSYILLNFLVLVSSFDMQHTESFSYSWTCHYLTFSSSSSSRSPPLQKKYIKGHWLLFQS